MPLLGHRYGRVEIHDITPHLSGLDLAIVGGLQRRGWTTNDIDVTGEREAARILDLRLKEAGIPHPVHLCGSRTAHSHLRCAYAGVKLAFTGRGY